MAAPRKQSDCHTWRPRSKLTSEVELHLCGLYFKLDKELLAVKSSKVAKLLMNNPQTDLSQALRDIPADQESMELVQRFCHGFTISLTAENTVRVACVAEYLGMTDSHSPDNLLTIALMFFKHQILPSWSNSIKALKSAENVLECAVDLGLVDFCIESIIKMVVDDPRLLGEPIVDNERNEESVFRPNARRKLFDIDWKLEDLTVLPLRLYMPIIRAVAQCSAPEEYIAASVYRYAKKWLFLKEKSWDNGLGNRKNCQREIVEALERLLPDRRGVIPCVFLFEMLEVAIMSNANTECMNGLENRIGKQLDKASVNNLLIPCRRYAKDGRYDTECVRRILKSFYCNYTESDDLGGLDAVAELLDAFLVQIASDVDLKPSTFLAFADMLVAASSGTSQRVSDGLYKAIDAYLAGHGHLTESEREELCRGLDCNRLSNEAREHAAQNGRLPIRLVVQVLFASQLRLREAIPDAAGGSGSGGRPAAEDGVTEEMERIEGKVKELERECDVMKKEMSERSKRESVWKAMKRKLGCGTRMDDDCNCYVKKKKVHPR